MTTSQPVDIILHTDTEILGVGLEKRVFLGLRGLAGAEGRRSRLLAGSGFSFGRLVIETRVG
jgi:hypothetical protein